MPRVELVLFQEDDGSIPVRDWLDELPRKAQAKCVAAMTRLELLGHELRRPEVDYLRDGIYELRVGLGGVNYRLLYFFHGRTAVVVSHGLVKKRVVPPREIHRAIERRTRFLAHPLGYSFRPESD